MRIRYVLLHAYGTGGTIRTVFNQANSMAAAGHDVEVVSVVRNRDTPQFPLDANVSVKTLVDRREGATAPGDGLVGRYRERRSRRLSTRGPKYVPKGELRSHLFTRDVEEAVIRYLRNLCGGVLVTTRPALNILAARHAAKGVTRVAQEHMNLGTHPKDVRTAIGRHYPLFDAVAVLTHGDRQDYEDFLPGTRVVCVPNAVHSAKQQPTTYARPIAVAAGRLVAQKGFDLLIPAFGQVVEHNPKCELRIFGSGEKKNELRALIEKYHLYNHVFLMGHTTKLDEELANASCYVLSSRFEGLPMVMIEAMTHGLPVVSFDCPTGPAEVITDGKEGVLVPPGDIDGLADAMRQLMDDEGLRADMGAAALMTARSSYSPEAVHPQWETLFHELHPAESGNGNGQRR
jgi:glycosyltransferase involved in cell wall biosynthesis